MQKIESLFLGIIAALGALVIIVTAAVAVQIFLPSEEKTIINAYFYAPAFIVFAVITEEFFKYLFISKKLVSRDTDKSLMINAVSFGAGFALAEILFISLNDNQTQNAYRNVLEIAAVHISTSVIIAWPFIMNLSKKSLWAFLAFSTAIGAHLSYNLLSLRGINIPYPLLSVLFFLLILAAILKTKRFGKSLA